MSMWSLTKQDIALSIANLVRRMSKLESISYQDNRTISDAFNAAIVDVATDYSMTKWDFLSSEATIVTVANRNYTDLAIGAFRIAPGSVRIADHSIMLTEISLVTIAQLDPAGAQKGIPTSYAQIGNETGGVRMQFYPVPDGEYTITADIENTPQKDIVSSIPPYLHAALKDKATENSLRDLGLIEASLAFERSYDNRLQNIRATQAGAGPRYINRRETVYTDWTQARIAE